MIAQWTSLSEAQIEIVVPQIRSLVLNDPMARRALGGQQYVYSEELSRELRQFGEFIQGGLPKRQRVRLGYCALDASGKVIGYRAITVMQNAMPNVGEARYIGLLASLDYIQGKKLVVRADYRGKGVATALFKYSLGLADELGKEFVSDVSATNHAVIRFLAKYGICKLFDWRNRAGNLMWRMGRV